MRALLAGGMMAAEEEEEEEEGVCLRELLANGPIASLSPPTWCCFVLFPFGGLCYPYLLF